MHVNPSVLLMDCFGSEIVYIWDVRGKCYLVRFPEVFEGSRLVVRSNLYTMQENGFVMWKKMAKMHPN